MFRGYIEEDYRHGRRFIGMEGKKTSKESPSCRAGGAKRSLSIKKISLEKSKQGSLKWLEILGKSQRFRGERWPIEDRISRS